MDYTSNNTSNKYIHFKKCLTVFQLSKGFTTVNGVVLAAYPYIQYMCESIRTPVVITAISHISQTNRCIIKHTNMQPAASMAAELWGGAYRKG